MPAKVFRNIRVKDIFLKKMIHQQPALTHSVIKKQSWDLGDRGPVPDSDRDPGQVTSSLEFLFFFMIRNTYPCLLPEQSDFNHNCKM